MADEEGGSGPGNFIWAITLLIIVGIVVAVLFAGGFLGGSSKKEVDVQISAPSR